MRNGKTKIKKNTVLGTLPRSLYLIWKRCSFRSHDYWEKRYASGGTSGAGSYGEEAKFKADVINAFVEQNNIKNVIEFGCGDGNQLKLANYPFYIGFDVSKTVVDYCKDEFRHDQTKDFKLLEEYNNEVADLGLSLDVIYLLIEDYVFEYHMELLFGASKRFVIIYSSNYYGNDKNFVPYVWNRQFTDWIDKYCPEWSMRQKIVNPYPYNYKNLYIFENQKNV